MMRIIVLWRLLGSVCQELKALACIISFDPKKRLSWGHLLASPLRDAKGLSQGHAALEYLQH